MAKERKSTKVERIPRATKVGKFNQKAMWKRVEKKKNVEKRKSNAREAKKRAREEQAQLSAPAKKRAKIEEEEDDEDMNSSDESDHEMPVSQSDKVAESDNDSENEEGADSDSESEEQESSGFSFASYKTLLPVVASTLTSVFPNFEPTTLQKRALSKMLHQFTTRGYTDFLFEVTPESKHTIAYLIPIINLVLKNGLTVCQQAFVFAPTEKAAKKIMQDLESITSQIEGHEIKSALCVDSESTEDNAKSTGRAHIVVGTPSAIADAIKEETYRDRLRNLQVLVVDQLDLKFSEEIVLHLAEFVERVHSRNKKRYHTVVATDSFLRKEFNSVLDIVVTSERFYTVTNNSEEDQIDIPKQQESFVVKTKLKLSTLVHLLKDMQKKKIVVVVSSHRAVQYFTNVLDSFLPDSEVYEVRTNVSAKARMQSIWAFMNAKSGILICTEQFLGYADLLCYANVQVLINYHVAKTAPRYTFRMNNCAKGAKELRVISLICEKFEEPLLIVYRKAGLTIHNNSKQINVASVEEIFKALKEWLLKYSQMKELAIDLARLERIGFNYEKKPEEMKSVLYVPADHAMSLGLSMSAVNTTNLISHKSEREEVDYLNSVPRLHKEASAESVSKVPKLNDEDNAKKRRRKKRDQVFMDPDRVAEMEEKEKSKPFSFKFFV